MNELYDNPYFLLGAQMAGANAGKGMAPGPAFGQAALGTALQLAQTRERAAQAARESKLLELKQAAQAEAERANKAGETAANKKQSMYERRPEDIGGGRFWTPAHGVQGGGMGLMDMLLMNQLGGVPGMMGGGGAQSGNPLDDTVNQFMNPSPQTAPPAPAAPQMPAPQAAPMMPAPQSAPSMPAPQSNNALNMTLGDLLNMNQQAGRSVLDWLSQQMNTVQRTRTGGR